MNRIRQYSACFWCLFGFFWLSGWIEGENCLLWCTLQMSDITLAYILPIPSAGLNNGCLCLNSYYFSLVTPVMLFRYSKTVKLDCRRDTWNIQISKRLVIKLHHCSVGLHIMRHKTANSVWRMCATAQYRLHGCILCITADACPETHIREHSFTRSFAWTSVELSCDRGRVCFSCENSIADSNKSTCLCSKYLESRYKRP